MPARAIDERRVKEIIADVYMRSPRDQPLTWEDIDSEAPLYSFEEAEASLGLDSLDAVEIAVALEEAFDVVLPAELDPADMRTVSQVTALLEEALAEQRAGP